MGLVGNYSNLHRQPGIAMSGQLRSGDRANFSKTGSMRNFGAQTGLNWKLAAIPNGYYSSGAWLLPKTRGAMASRREARVSIDLTGSGALGKNAVGSVTITIEASAIGGLIAGGVGIASIAVQSDGSVVATISSPGSATITIGAIANPGAIGWLTAETLLTINGTLQAYATGSMSGTTADSGAITPEALAAALWNALAVDYNLAGSMGAKLNAAGSASDPWDTPSGKAVKANTGLIPGLL